MCGLIVCNFVKKDRTRSKTNDEAHDEVNVRQNIGRKQASHILAQRRDDKGWEERGALTFQ